MSNRWSGIGYPWGPDIKSLVEPKTDKEILMTSVINILLTRFGERVMNCRFGSELADALFEPLSDTMFTSLQEDARQAIAEWDDRIDLKELVGTRNRNTLSVRVLFSNAKDSSAQLQTLAFDLPLGLSM
jgi:phage baseplate assembly protein W